MRIAIVVAVALSTLVSGCGGSNGPVNHPGEHTSTGGETSRANVSRRYAVVISPEARRAAGRHGIDLGKLTWQVLTRAGSQLPGGTYPTAVVHIATGTRQQTIPEIGVNGYTHPEGGAIDIVIDPATKLGLARALRLWFPSTVAHEAQNSARVLHGPGFGQDLLQWLVSEGLADAFSARASPATPPLPWVRALSAPQEQDLWKRAQPILSSGGTRLYDSWFFGGNGIPRWAGYTIGTHIVEDYLARHPAAHLTGLSLRPASEILAGSGYLGR